MRVWLKQEPPLSDHRRISLEVKLMESRRESVVDVTIPTS
jgi:hypothetical protein